MFTKSEWGSFKRSDGYTELQGVMIHTMEGAIAEIAGRTEPDTNRDQFLRGFIYAMRGLMEYEPKFIEETEEEDNDADEV